MDGLRVVLKRLDPALLKPPPRCDFCGLTDNDELLYGKMHTLDNINTHYYCLLFACNLPQNGEDSEGILGFLANDIRTEIRCSQKQTCSYCLKPGATVICVQRMCKKVFHLPCGMKNGSLHHFFKNFQSFCKAHRPWQRVPQYQLMLPDAPVCAICLETVKRDPKNRSVVWAPCCKLNAWLHRLCVQKLALHAGYFFKCPRCNNTVDFCKAMLACGIYVPEQDASWELEPNAFEELHHRHSHCDASDCICPQGRDHDVDDTLWEVILCESCGSQGIHLGCLGAQPRSWRKWSCQVCTEAVKSKEPIPSTSSSEPPCSSSAAASAAGLPVSPGKQQSGAQQLEWADSESSSSSCSSNNRETTGSSDQDPADADVLPPKRRRMQRWEGGPEVLFNEEASEDDLVEVVDVEEEHKQAEILVAKDGTSIPIVFLDESISDTTKVKVEGDLKSLVEEADVDSNEPIIISDSESNDGSNGGNSTDSHDVVCLD